MGRAVSRSGLSLRNRTVVAANNRPEVDDVRPSLTELEGTQLRQAILLRRVRYLLHQQWYE